MKKTPPAIPPKLSKKKTPPAIPPKPSKKKTPPAIPPKPSKKKPMIKLPDELSELEMLKKELADARKEIEEIKLTKKTGAKRETKKMIEQKRIDKIPNRKVGLPSDVSTKKLQEHQLSFVDNFINGFPKGAMAIHGVGSGKTLTAIVSAETFLNKFPTSKVIVITPASLLAGFKQELYTYDPAIEKDKRYSFFTYDGYSNAIKRGNSAADCQDALLVIDEAQNLRTPIRRNVFIDSNKDKIVEVKSGAKVLSILENCSLKAKKILLLSATPIVNNIYDIENLMAMINGHLPLNRKDGYFDQILNSPELLARYFGCRLSFFEHSPAVRERVFPAMDERYVPIIMDNDTLEKYNSVNSNRPSADLREELGISEDTQDINAFYTGIRKAVNAIGGEYSQKINFIMDWLIGVRDQEPNEAIGLTRQILDTHTNKTVIFTHFKGVGSNLIIERLKKNGFKYGSINGSVSKKNRAKIVDEYVKGNIEVILISKAGAEGLNLLETGYIIIVEPSWNNTEQEQVKGRGVRFMSHINLPKEKQNVMVLDLFLIRPKEIGEFNQIIRTVQQSLKPDYQLKKKKEYDDEMKKLNEVLNYILDNKDKKGRLGLSFQGWWNKYRKSKPLNYDTLKDELQKPPKKSLLSEAMRKKEDKKIQERNSGFSNIYEEDIVVEAKKKFNLKYIPPNTIQEFLLSNNEVEGINTSSPSVDLRLFHYANSKQLAINSYLSELKKIDSVEKCTYPSEFLDVASIFEIKSDRPIPPLTKWEKDFYKNIITDTKFKKPAKEAGIDDMLELKNDMTRLTRSLFGDNKLFVQTQNAFFTPPTIARDMIKFSGIDTSPHDVMFLEPTAGAGFIIYEALMSNKKIYASALENIDNLRDMLKTFPRTITLPQDNFFDLPNSKKYRVIIMNPPFNIKAGMALPSRKAYDVDFVMKAFNDHLMDDGILVCLIGSAFEFRGSNERMKADRKIFQPFRDLLANNEHSIIKYEDGFSKADGAVVKEMETKVQLRMIKILKKML